MEQLFDETMTRGRMSELSAKVEGNYRLKESEVASKSDRIHCLSTQPLPRHQEEDDLRNCVAPWLSVTRT